MNKKIFLAGLLCLASVASVVGMVGNAHEVEAANVDNSKEKWSAIGTISGSSWNKDFPLSYDSTDDRYELEIALKANDEFKVRLNNSWSVAIGYGNGIANGSTYLSKSGENCKVKTTGNYIIWVKDDNVRNYDDKSYGLGIEKAADVVYHTVTHYSQDGTVLKTDDKVIENSAYEPAFAEVEGYALEGWYKDQALTQKMEKGAKVTGDLTLYPKYVEVEDYVIYFKDSESVFGETVNAYLWSDHTDGHDNSWPGTSITKEGNRGWKVEVDASKSYDKIIFSDGKETPTQTQDIDLSEVKHLDTFVLSSKDLNEKYNVTLESTGTKYEVADLLTSYYNGGVYTRKTTININKEAVEDDLARKYNDNTNTYESLFHAKAILLERTTYFNEDALWMSNEETKEKGTYSYYGTKYDGNTPVGVTGGRVSLNETTSNVVLSGEGKESMENYYTTMYDIKANEAEWTKTGEVYSTNNPAVIQMFLDFTAPCFLNLNNNEINNYFSLDHVEVEETSNGLELRLVTTGDSGKLTENANNVLSVATITTK